MADESMSGRQAAELLLQAIGVRGELTHEQAQELIPELIEAEQAGQDVDDLPEFAALLRHLDECVACTEIYAGVAEDLATLSPDSPAIQLQPTVADRIWSPVPPSAAETRRGPAPRSERQRLFDAEHMVNRAALREISTWAFGKLSSKQERIPLPVLDSVISDAARGQVGALAKGVSFAYGDAGTLLKVIVPLAVNLVASALWGSNLEHVQQLKSVARPLPELTEDDVRNLLERAGTPLEQALAARLARTINEALDVYLAKAVADNR